MTEAVFVIVVDLLLRSTLVNFGRQRGPSLSMEGQEQSPTRMAIGKLSPIRFGFRHTYRYGRFLLILVGVEAKTDDAAALVDQELPASREQLQELIAKEVHKATQKLQSAAKNGKHSLGQREAWCPEEKRCADC